MPPKIMFRDVTTGTELILPVTPPGYTVEQGRKVDKLTMQEVGEVTLPGALILMDKELECMLPARNYAFLQAGAVPTPYLYLEQLIRWSQEDTPLRYVVEGSTVNVSVRLGAIRYEERDGTGDVYATIPIHGRRALALETRQSSQTENTDREVEKAPATQSSYTVVKGDTLSAICRKFYGNANLYPKLAAHNQIKNPHLIYVGQVIQIPDGESL